MRAKPGLGEQGRKVEIFGKIKRTQMRAQAEMLWNGVGEH